jgi:hypothetical protein
MQTACDELVALQIYQNQPHCFGVAFGMSATQGCIHGGAGSPCPLNCGMLGASRGQMGRWGELLGGGNAARCAVLSGGTRTADAKLRR